MKHRFTRLALLGVGSSVVALVALVNWRATGLGRSAICDNESFDPSNCFAIEG